ncbi:hypothetical protein DL93DRAFT_2081883 [Clavulina sp. PMI_390]|nr:hypothetical protein DL93DRAFT_2081883 [Clavulina sp. PMI_390]
MVSSSSLFYLSAALLSLIPAVHGHARVTSPPIRTPGNAFQQQCGTPSFQSVTSDPTGHIEEQEPFNAGCQPTLCRGMLFQDQPASNVQQVIPGQAMNMGVDCTIPHGGPANVSLVDTTVGGAGVILGSFLATFSDFCPTSGGTPADQSNIQFNLPSANVIGSKCQNAGDCVVQLFWATPDFSQNYYYCVDVKVNAVQASTTTSSTTSSSATPVAPSTTVPAVVQAENTSTSESFSSTPIITPTLVAPTVVTTPSSMVTITTTSPTPSTTSNKSTGALNGGAFATATTGGASGLLAIALVVGLAQVYGQVL